MVSIHDDNTLFTASDNLGVSESTIKRAINDLKGMGLINSERSKIKGEWQLIEKD